MKRNLLVAAILMVFTTVAFSQSAEEALRYSELRFGGSARGMAVAGAFGAIGADYSSVISNPAGLALYHKHELTFTMRLEQIKTASVYERSHTSDQRFNFNIGNMGMAFAGKKRAGNWKNINFGIGYNRLANFHSERFYHSNSTGNSILNSYVDEATGTDANQISNSGLSLGTKLAYQGYLINPLPSDLTRYTSVADDAEVVQHISVETKGALDELSFSVAGNYKDKLYVGGYIGIPFIFYRERSYHQETNTNAENDWFNAFDMNNQLNTFGAGVNLKLGMIYRPSDWLRLGASFHTPTFFGMHDDFSSYVNAYYDTIPDTLLVFPVYLEGNFDYHLVTPMRFVGSIGLIMKKYAFISFDYEWVDYSKAHYNTEPEFGGFEASVNSDIERLYGSAHIFKVGAEGALDNLRLRIGYAHYGSPYKNASELGDYDGSANYFTGGIGIRLKKVYFDFAYVRGISKSVNLVINDEFAYDETKRNTFMLTTGFRF